MGRAGDSATRVSLKVEERRRERRAAFGEGEVSGSVDGVGESEEEDEEREGDGENGEMYTGDGTRTGGTATTEPGVKLGSPLLHSRRHPNSESVGVHTGVVTGTSLRRGEVYRLNPRSCESGDPGEASAGSAGETQDSSERRFLDAVDLGRNRNAVNLGFEGSLKGSAARRRRRMT